MYDGSIRITYLDNKHAYYKQDRVNYGLPETDEKAWGKKTRPKGTTTLLGDTLEKKGIALWMAGQSLFELFGFYDFEGSDGKRMTGFSKKNGGGTLRSSSGGLTIMKQEELLEKVLSASKAWQRKQKSGADVGSLVHDAIEQYVLGTPFELTMAKYEEGQDFTDDAATREWLKTAPAELEMAKLAYERFKLWWMEMKPTLVNAEQIVYSKEFDVAGAYDALLMINNKRILVDWKTSNASVSAGAPQGVYYSYFIQSAAYACALMEMGHPKIDDLMIVSARKDGEFDTVSASQVGLSVEDVIEWWQSVVHCYRMMDKTKRALVQLGE